MNEKFSCQQFRRKCLATALTTRAWTENLNISFAFENFLILRACRIFPDDQSFPRIEMRSRVRERGGAEARFRRPRELHLRAEVHHRVLHPDARDIQGVRLLRRDGEEQESRAGVPHGHTRGVEFNLVGCCCCCCCGYCYYGCCCCHCGCCCCCRDRCFLFMAAFAV